MTSSLSALAVLAFDCQATHPDPRCGHLLEVGWVSVCPEEGVRSVEGKAKGFLVQLPEDASVPPQVLKVTGLGREELKRGVPIQDVARELVADMVRVGARNRTGLCPIVIHYSRYEKPFLEHLMSEAGSEPGIATEIICTHEISKRLLEGLPRRGLRAVAGFLGHSVSWQRRAEGHAVATALIWDALVSLLGKECDVTDLSQLRDWLETTPGSVACGTQFPMKRTLRLGVTDEPGVYRMRRSNGDLLYVGKATSLRQRVNSYFQRKKQHPEHILEMLAQAYSLDVTVTPSSLEAALLESDEIKRLSPPYNIALQGKGREVAFVSRNLQSVSSVPDVGHPHGPLVGQLFPLSSLTLVLTDPEQNKEIVPETLLGVPEGYCPDQECCHQGIEIFRSSYAGVWLGGSIERRLLWLGARLWKLRMDEREAKESSPADAEPEEEKVKTDQPVWTPERVCRRLEGAVIYGAHLLRRARWFCALSDSMLVWRSRSDPEKRMLVRLEGGRMMASEVLGPEAPLPAVGPSPPIEDRKGRLDLADFDRLSVLTAELRRLVRDGRSVTLRLGGFTLSNRQLVQVLRWV